MKEAKASDSVAVWIVGLVRLIALRISITLLTIHIASAPVASVECSEATTPSDSVTVLDSGCYAHFDYLLEKTFLKVDVLRLRLSVDHATASAVARLAKDQRRDRDLENAIVSSYMEAHQVDVVLSFMMSIDHDRFVNSAAKTSRRLAKQGWISQSDAAVVSEDTALRFEFLKGRGVNEDDCLYYRVRGDSVQTRFVSAAGDTLLDDLRIGPERKAALLGSYFAPETNFHDGLLDLVFDCR